MNLQKVFVHYTGCAPLAARKRAANRTGRRADVGSVRCVRARLSRAAADLLDGTKFDSSYTSKDEPFGFRLGKGKVITGWEATVPAMVPGMRLVVRIPPEFAYGDKSVGKIPANSPLIFYSARVPPRSNPCH